MSQKSDASQIRAGARWLPIVHVITHAWLWKLIYTRTQRAMVSQRAVCKTIGHEWTSNGTILLLELSPNQGSNHPGWKGGQNEYRTNNKRSQESNQAQALWIKYQPKIFQVNKNKSTGRPQTNKYTKYQCGFLNRHTPQCDREWKRTKVTPSTHFQSVLGALQFISCLASAHYILLLLSCSVPL